MARRAPDTNPAEDSPIDLDAPPAPRAGRGAPETTATNPTNPAPAAAAPPPAPPQVPWKDQDRVLVLEQIVVGELRIDPRAAWDELRAAERMGTTVAQTQAGLNEVLRLAALASRFAMFARRQAKLYEATGYEAELAALRDAAREKIPRTPLADGKGFRQVSKADLDAWLAQNMAAEYAAVERRRVDLSAFAEHAERVAELWKWRGTDLRRMSEAAQAQGDFADGR